MAEQETGNATIPAEKERLPVSVHIALGIVAAAFSIAFMMSRPLGAYEAVVVWFPVGAIVYNGRSVTGRVGFVYLALVYPLLAAQGSMMGVTAIQRAYVLILLASALFLLWKVFPALSMPKRLLSNNGNRIADRRPTSPLKAAILSSLGVLLVFYSLARWGNEIWIAVRPVGHYLVILIPVAVLLGIATSRIRIVKPATGIESARPLIIAAGIIILLFAKYGAFYSYGSPDYRDATYSTLLREVVAKRDWLRSAEGRKASYEQKTRTLGELDRQFSLFLHSQADDGKIWLLRGLLNRMRPDGGSKRLDPLCFEEAGRRLGKGNVHGVFSPYNERSFFEEAVGRLVELGYVKTAAKIALDAPKTDWSEALREQIPPPAEYEYRNIDVKEAMETSEEPLWPARQRIGYTAELIGFGPTDALPTKDPRERIELTGGERLSLEAWIRFREEATLHPKTLHLSGVQGIHFDVPLDSDLGIAGEPWKVVRLPIGATLPQFLGPLVYDISLVFDETWDFPPGPLTCPLTILDVFPRLSREKAPVWKVQQVYGDISYVDLGVRTIVAPGKGFHGSAPERVSAVGLILVSGLFYASGVPFGTQVGEIQVEDRVGNSVNMPMRVGIETAEILADNPRAKSSRDEVGIWTSYEQKVGDGPETFEAHQYHTRIDFREPMTVSRVGVEITGEKTLFLNVFHVLLVRANE